MTFNPKLPPIVLPQRCLCPFNARNTIFHQAAFWGLLLPVTPNNMTCDVWRGYWAQRLLWDIGGQLLFQSGIAYQHQTSNKGQGNLVDGMELDARASHVAEFVLQWSSDSAVFHERILSLSQAFADQGFWGTEDVILTKAWIEVKPEVDVQFSPSFPIILFTK